MYTGRLIFSQLMDHLPMPTFRRCVERYQGDRWVKSFRCVEHYRCMAFAQLTYRESLRDIEACLRAQGAKLYHMGIRGAVSRSTLADANEQRDWRIYADFAQRLIHTARRLYVDDALALELDETVYALDSSTIDLCLTLFPWADFRKTKAAVKLHTLLDLRGSIPAFIHISTGKLHDVNVMDLLMPEAGAFYVMDRAYVDFARLHTLHRAHAFFVVRAKSNTQLRRLYSHPVDRSAGVICDQTIVLTGVTTPDSYPDKLRRIKVRDARARQDPGLPDQQLGPPSIDHRRALSMPLASRAVLQMDQAAPAHQILLRHLRERRADANLDRGLRLRARRHHQEETQSGPQPLHNSPDPQHHRIREIADKSGAYGHRIQTARDGVA